MQNRVRFVALALASFILSFLGSFFAPGAFLNRLTATALCSLLSFQSNACLAQLPRTSERAVAAVSTLPAEQPGHNNDEQKVAVCVLGVCVNLPRIPDIIPKAPSGNQPSPTASPQQPRYGAEEFSITDNEKPATDLTGVWISKGSIFTLDNRGCTLGWAGKITDNGQDADKGFEGSVTQNGNQLTYPDVTVNYTGISSGSYIQHSKGKISGNRVEVITGATPSTGAVTFRYIGTVSADGNTISGKVSCKTTAGPATAEGTFTSVRKQSCPRFQTMLSSAKDIKKLADTLERDDKAYHTAVVDIILRGYSAPYAVYMLDVPSEEIPDYFKDEQQISAVRSQIISRIRTKADNRERFAQIGMTGDYIPATPVYAKENIDLFCSLDSSEFTKEFWDSLWMAGYTDYDFYTEIENQLIRNYYKNYFDTLVQIASLIPQTRGLAYLYRFKGRDYLFTKPELEAVKILESKKLPEVTTTAAEDIEQGIQLSPERQRHILDGDTNASGDIIGGGHGAGRNVPGKSQFPSSWSDEKTIQNIKDVVRDPNSKWTQQTGKLGARYTNSGKPVKYQVDGTRDSVNIRVIIQPDGEGIITAFPTNIPPNP